MKLRNPLPLGRGGGQAKKMGEIDIIATKNGVLHALAKILYLPGPCLN